MTAAEAAIAIREGKTIRMTVGTGAGDPVLLIRREGNTIMSEAVGGWSAGVTEAVCFIESRFLEDDFLKDRHALELVAEDNRVFYAPGESYGH